MTKAVLFSPESRLQYQALGALARHWGPQSSRVMLLTGLMGNTTTRVTFSLDSCKSDGLQRGPYGHHVQFLSETGGPGGDCETRGLRAGWSQD